MLSDKNAVLQVIGALLKRPQYLSETEKYCLTTDDFTSSFEKIIFSSIYNLYLNGAEKVSRIDIDNYLKDFPSSYQIFSQQKGLEYLSDAEFLAQEDNFPYYYKRIKKFSCLRQLKKMGYDIKKIYDDNPLSIDAKKTNEKFDQLEVSDIFNLLKRDLMQVESSFNSNETNETREAFSGLESLIENLQNEPEIGSKLQGDIFNTIVKGARKGKYYVRSLSSGVGKTRSLVGDACYIAYPIRYNSSLGYWIKEGNSEKVLFVATEQNFDEIQTLILAYLTDINEDKIITGNCSDEEKDRIKKAIYIVNEYKDNFLITRMPNPDITQIKAIIRQNYLVHDIQNVFYDYIFSSPSLLSEFRDLKIREDICLMLLSTALKDLAVELNIFVMTATQLNAEAEEKKGIKNQSCIRGRYMIGPLNILSSYHWG